jgi:hypothetical protein
MLFHLCSSVVLNQQGMTAAFSFISLFPPHLHLPSLLPPRIDLFFIQKRPKNLMAILSHPASDSSLRQHSRNADPAYLSTAGSPPEPHPDAPIAATSPPTASWLFHSSFSNGTIASARFSGEALSGLWIHQRFQALERSIAE